MKNRLIIERGDDLSVGPKMHRWRSWPPSNWEATLLAAECLVRPDAARSRIADRYILRPFDACLRRNFLGLCSAFGSARIVRLDRSRGTRRNTCCLRQNSLVSLGGTCAETSNEFAGLKTAGRDRPEGLSGAIPFQTDPSVATRDNQNRPTRVTQDGKPYVAAGNV